MRLREGREGFRFIVNPMESEMTREPRKSTSDWRIIVRF